MFNIYFFAQLLPKEFCCVSTGETDKLPILRFFNVNPPQNE